MDKKKVCVILWFDLDSDGTYQYYLIGTTKDSNHGPYASIHHRASHTLFLHSRSLFEIPVDLFRKPSCTIPPQVGSNKSSHIFHFRAEIGDKDKSKFKSNLIHQFKINTRFLTENNYGSSPHDIGVNGITIRHMEHATLTLTLELDKMRKIHKRISPLIFPLVKLNPTRKRHSNNIVTLKPSLLYNDELSSLDNNSSNSSTSSRSTSSSVSGNKCVGSYGVVLWMDLEGNGRYDYMLVQVSVSTRKFTLKIDPFRGSVESYDKTPKDTASRELKEESFFLFDISLDDLEFPYIYQKEKNQGIYHIRVDLDEGIDSLKVLLSSRFSKQPWKQHLLHLIAMKNREILMKNKLTEYFANEVEEIGFDKVTFDKVTILSSKTSGKFPYSALKKRRTCSGKFPYPALKKRRTCSGDVRNTDFKFDVAKQMREILDDMHIKKIVPSDFPLVKLTPVLARLDNSDPLISFSNKVATASGEAIGYLHSNIATWDRKTSQSLSQQSRAQRFNFILEIKAKRLLHLYPEDYLFVVKQLEKKCDEVRDLSFEESLKKIWKLMKVYE